MQKEGSFIGTKYSGKGYLGKVGERTGCQGPCRKGLESRPLVARLAQKLVHKQA